jgi:hypothetical protein
MNIRAVGRGNENERERGAVMVLTALFMSVMAIFVGGTLTAVTLYGANQEGRRAADLAALSAAASLPTLNLTACADNDTICNPRFLPNEHQINTNLGTVDLNGAVPLPNLNWTTGSCNVADQQFVNGRSPINQVFKVNGNPKCTPQAQYTQPWMQMVADCIQNLSTCTAVQNSLNSILPTPIAPLSTAIQSALTAADATTKLVSSTLMTTLNTLNNVSGLLGVCFAFGGPGCLTPLINALGGSQLSLNLASLAPALLTPQVKMTVAQQVNVPGAALIGMGDSTIQNTATARRAFKNAVLLPAIGPKRADGTYVVNPNALLANAKDLMLTALGLVDQTVSPLVQSTLTPLVCSSNPTPCQVPSLLGDQLTDLNDLFNPPGGQPPPDGNAILNQAVANGQPVLIATLGTVVNPSSILGGSLWNLLAPLLGLGVGNLLVAPALDFMPATLTNGGPVGYIATPARTLVLAGQTQGLYRARLVD